VINYRVQNIEGLLRKLKNNGVTIVDEIATYDYGKFVHILDSEGIKLNCGSLLISFSPKWEDKQQNKTDRTTM
jgi:hypothetical protein